VLAFAYGQRHPVVDVNVRRVAARAITGVANCGPATTSADMDLVERLLPESTAPAARLSAALMELGAVICVSRTPGCSGCPLSEVCAWRAAGSPPDEGPRRPSQKYEGTDRYVRGRIMALLREGAVSVPVSAVDTVWHLPEQRDRALASLLVDGLVVKHGPDRLALAGASEASSESLHRGLNDSW
jgi:A/G-specific adenine glycosylase